MLCRIRMGTDGLPMHRRELGVQEDIIAGSDFLSVLMESPALRQAYKELSTTDLPSVTRLGRSTPPLGQYEFPPIATNSFFKSTEENTSSDSPQLNSTNNMIVSIESHSPAEDADLKEETYLVEVTTARVLNILSEEHSTLVSNTHKREYGAGQPDAVTFSDYLHDYSSKVDHLRNTNHITKSQSIIYHNNPVKSNNDRSVSYSTVIQTLPKEPPTYWHEENHLQYHGDRKERHYDVNNSGSENKLEKPEDNFKSKTTSSWEKPEQGYASTERNWEVAEKDHSLSEMQYSTPPTRIHSNQRFPIIYGKPEENYEVDEAVSVMSSGRRHGVQPSTKSDNPKVGYVVEGRNYRKYRVEERTSDGFIVGEYGVVSHDDGSLRGVRYTADGNINPRIVYDALMKFLSL